MPLDHVDDSRRKLRVEEFRTCIDVLAAEIYTWRVVNFARQLTFISAEKKKTSVAKIYKSLILHTIHTMPCMCELFNFFLMLISKLIREEKCNFFRPAKVQCDCFWSFSSLFGNLYDCPDTFNQVFSETLTLSVNVLTSEKHLIQSAIRVCLCKRRIFFFLKISLRVIARNYYELTTVIKAMKTRGELLLMRG